MGHIGKFYKSGKGESDLRATELSSNSSCARRTTGYKVKIGPNTIDLLYDIGSQFTIITRKVYESLHVKPPLIPLHLSGISITGRKLYFDGVAYLNLEFQKPNGSLHTVEYEPILVSPVV